ncbi:MAG: branched-chain amino acid ABC transporter permease [Desulfobacterales bacterium]
MSANRWMATGNYFTTYRQEQRIFSTHLDRLIFVLFIASLFVWPFFLQLSTGHMYVVDNILIAVIAVYGLNLVTGFGGQISVGHAAFMGIGAYTVASTAGVIGDQHFMITHAWPLMILLAGLIGTVFGLIVGLPALRLKHFYLLMATLSFQLIFQWVIGRLEFFNQGQFIYVGRVHWFTGEVSRLQHYMFWYYVLVVVAVVGGLGVRNLLRTRYGRSLVAVRDNDRAADAMGMHPGFTKVFAFGLSGFFAGIAGAMMAYINRGAGFETFTLHESIRLLAMSIVGGLGQLTGCIFGPAAIDLLDLQVENLARWAGDILPSYLDLATGLRPLSFGLVIVLFLMFEPRGIANWWRILRSYVKLWPFRY